MPILTDEAVANLRAWNLKPVGDEQRTICDLCDDLIKARAELAIWERHRQTLLWALNLGIPKQREAYDEIRDST